MALQSVFKQFLAAPNTTFLTDNASLHYINTLVTYNGPAEIIKHLNTQVRQLKKKEEKFLDVIEGHNALAVEVETSIQFLTGGGAYLPGLDDNFLADRLVTFPIIYIVNFGEDGKITQVRQNWDQGSLLKLIDVIGKTGRNWPIRDGQDQIKLITSSVRSAGRPAGGAGQAAPRQQEIVNRSRENSTNVTRDPHASLALFAPRDPDAEASLPAVVAPRASAKPPPRDYHDLFVGNDLDPSKQAPPVTEQAESPSKFAAGIATKAGAGRNYQPIRLFEMEENQQQSPEKKFSADHFYRPNPKKYQHFDFADGTDPQDAPKPSPAQTVKSKHGSQWKFDDFNTPAKVIPTKVLRGQEVRHWGNEEDPVIDSPIKQKKVDKPRKDAETHFEFVDDGTPEGTRRIVGRPRGAGHNTGLGLYKNDLFDDDNEGEPLKSESRVLGNIANVKDRRKDFDPHFAITDESPSAQAKQAEKLSEDKLRAAKMMELSRAATDSTPSSTNQKENAAPAPPSSVRPGTGKGPLSESTNTMSKRNDNPKGIAIGGDGMGGKKGSGRSWGFGDDSDGEEAGGLNGTGSKFSKGVPGRKQGTSAQTGGGDFWNF